MLRARTFRGRRNLYVHISRTLTNLYAIFSELHNGDLNRSSRPEMFCKKRCSWNFHKIHSKTPVPESGVLLAMACNFIKKEALTQVFFWEFCENFKNNSLKDTSGGCFSIKPQIIPLLPKFTSCNWIVKLIISSRIICSSVIIQV